MGKLSCLFAVLTLGIVGCKNDDYPINNGDDDPVDDPDANPDQPDMDPTAPDAGPDAAGDGGAPVITLVAPAAGTLVSGQVLVRVDVSDGDGIADVDATAGDATFTMSSVAGSDVWQGTFESLDHAGVVALPITIRARDNAGDEGELGFVLILDNQPPVASLDPANLREARIKQGSLQCSWDFDPLGGDAPNDGESVAQLVELRARVADLPNTGTINSVLFIPYAGVQTTDLYVLDDTSRPLVVDTDADGVCDAINPDIVPATTPDSPNEALVLELAAIEGLGAADFTGGAPFGGENAAMCAQGDDETLPSQVCIAEPGLTRVITTAFDNLPQVYGIPPVGSINCTGFAVDMTAATVADGWACAAVAMVDNLGNASVSPPLRICVDKDGNEAECAAWGSIAPPGSRPNCTGTVTGGVVNTTPCTMPVPFPTGDEANEYEVLLR